METHLYQMQAEVKDPDLPTMGTEPQKRDLELCPPSDPPPLPLPKSDKT